MGGADEATVYTCKPCMSSLVPRGTLPLPFTYTDLVCLILSHNHVNLFRSAPSSLRLVSFQTAF